jgi:ubiquinone/menaquinone biosynthesis C-methylase UbiE
MKKERVPETDNGIQGSGCVEVFDAFARNMRDRGYHPVGKYVEKGLTGGSALEIGPGPGYVGLEWLKACPGSILTGLEISPDMIRVAERNAGGYGLRGRVNYIQGSTMAIPFGDGSFDCVFSNGSLHEWENPVLAFGEIVRVLKSGGAFCVTDLRRDMSLAARLFALASARPKAIRPGFLTSLEASYTKGEIAGILGSAPIGAVVETGFMDLSITGKKGERR